MFFLGYVKEGTFFSYIKFLRQHEIKRNKKNILKFQTSTTSLSTCNWHFFFFLNYETTVQNSLKKIIRLIILEASTPIFLIFILIIRHTVYLQCWRKSFLKHLFRPILGWFIGCRVKANSTHMGLGFMGKVSSVEVFLRDPSPHLLEL